MQNREPTYPGRVTMTPVAGLANTYDMERADQPLQPGTPLNKATLLKDATAALFGLDSTAVPDDILAALGRYKQYWWRRRAPKTTGYIEKLTDITSDVRLDVGTWLFYKTMTISQTDGAMSLSDPITISPLNADTIVAQAPVYCTRSGTNVIYLVPDNATAYTSTNSYYDSSKTVVSYDYDDNYYIKLTGSGNPRAQVVSSQYVVGSPGDWYYLQSSDRSAYPDSGTSGGYEYEYLGIPFDNAVTAPRIETGSYVGTGTHGTYNKSSLAFDHRPLLVILFGYYTQIFSGMIPSGFNAKAPPFEDGGNQYCNYRWNGNVLKWNTNSSGPEGQNNTTGQTYYYMAIG